MNYPDSWDSFISYLQEASNHVFTPFFCEGGNDRTLLALIGSVVQARAGVSAYEKLCELLKSAENLEAVLNVPLEEGGEAALTLGAVLDMFCQWARACSSSLVCCYKK